MLFITAIRSLIFLAALLVQQPATPPTAPPAQQEQTGKADAETVESVKRWVGLLSSPIFERRQEATRELWQLGPKALPELESWASRSRGDALIRLNDLILFARCDVGPEENENVIDCVSGFLEREYTVQRRSLEKLCFLDRRPAAFRLVELVEDNETRIKLRRVCTSSIDDAKKALRSEDSEKIKAWIEDPTSKSSFKAAYYYWRWMRGELDDEIKALKEQVKPELEAGAKYKVALEKFKKKKGAQRRKKDKMNPPKVPSQEILRDLIGVLRFQRRAKEAAEYANEVVNESKRRELTHTILMESGDWSSLQSLIVSAKQDEDEDEEGIDQDADEDTQTKKPPKDGLAYTADGYKKALIEFYAGDEKAFAASLSEIKKGLKPGSSKSTYREFLDYTLEREPDEPEENNKKKKKLTRSYTMFTTLASQRRYDELFDLFGWNTVEQRIKYFKRRLSTIKAVASSARLIRKANVLEELAVKEIEKLDDRRQQMTNHYQQAVRLVASLGMTEESEYYLRRFYFELAGDREFDFVAKAVIVALQSQGAYQSAMEIASIEAKRTDDGDAFSLVLKTYDARGRILNNDAISELESKLKDSIKDPSERYKVIAKLVKSPAASETWKDIDIWSEFDRYGITFGNGPADQLFRIWHIDEKFLSRSTRSNEPIVLARDCVSSGNYLQAGQLFETLASSNDSHSYFGKAAWAYRKAGNEQKAQVMQMLFMLDFEPDDAYEYLDEFNGEQWQMIAFDAMRLHDCLREDSIGENCYYLWRMTEQDEKGFVDPFQAMIRTQLLRLYYIDSPYLDDSEQDIARFVRGGFANGNIETAARWYRKILKHRAADASLCESVFPLLIKSNQTETLDDLFMLTSEEFYKVLSRFPDSPLLLNNYAWVCAKAKKNLDNAIELSQKSVKLRPGNPQYWDTLAELYFANGEKQKAIEAIRRSIELAPETKRYREQLKKFEGTRATNG